MVLLPLVDSKHVSKARIEREIEKLGLGKYSPLGYHIYVRFIQTDITRYTPRQMDRSTDRLTDG